MANSTTSIDPVILDRMLSGFKGLADGFVRQAAGHMTPEALETLCGSALYLLQLGAQGDFHGRLDVEIKGADIRPVRVVAQTVSLSSLYGVAFYGGLQDTTSSY